LDAANYIKGLVCFCKLLQSIVVNRIWKVCDG
jgi:hypothetical protein